MPIFKRFLDAIRGRPGGRAGPPAMKEAVWLRDRAQLDALIETTGFAAAAADIHRQGRPCLHALFAARADDAPIGATRFGGFPDLPPATAWPTAPLGGNLSFFAQVALDDLSSTVVAGLLPAKGLLSFFAGAFDHGGGPPGVAVILTHGAELARRQPPAAERFDDPGTARLQPVSVRFEPGLCFPLCDLHWLETLQQACPEGDIDGLAEALAAAPRESLGRLLGHASWTADDLREQLHFEALGRAGQERLRLWRSWEDWQGAKAMNARLANGTIYRPWSAADDDNVRWILDHAEAITEGVERWQSLLEIESNRMMNLWINDANPAYFFVRGDDLGRGDFSRAKVVATQH